MSVLAKLVMLNLVLTIAMAALGARVVVQPERFFKNSFASQSQLDDIASQLDDVSSRLDDLETGSGDQAGTSVDEIASSLDDLQTQLGSMCDVVGNYGGAFEDIYTSAC